MERFKLKHVVPLPAPIGLFGHQGKDEITSPYYTGLTNSESRGSGARLAVGGGLETGNVDFEPCRFRAWVCAKGTSLRSCVCTWSEGYVGET